jgi:hypothetical protein
MKGPRLSTGAHHVEKVAVCARSALSGAEVQRARQVCAKSTVRERPQRRLGRGGAVLVWILAVISALAACSSGSRKPVADSTTVPIPTSLVQPTGSTVPSVGQQAFLAYQNAFAVIAQIEGDPTGRSTDPRLKAALVDPWLTQIVQMINNYRLRDQVVRGTYSFANFHLDSVTPDGRVIFTDCQTNSQAVYSAKTGALVGNDSTARLPEQVVVYHPSADVWRVADDNAVTTGSICAG